MVAPILDEELIPAQEQSMGGFIRPQQFEQTDDANIGGETKTVRGSGTPMIPVHGLKELLGIRIGSQVVPLSSVIEMPTHPNWQDRPTTYKWRQAHFQIVGEPGKEELMRWIGSNDGIWQASETIYVTGVWGSKAKGSGS